MLLRDLFKNIFKFEYSVDIQIVERYNITNKILGNVLKNQSITPKKSKEVTNGHIN